MTDTKHTPGPWSLDGGIVKTDDRPIAEIYRELISSEATVCNANLIASAPELLEALQDMVSDVNQTSDATLNFAKKAIAKAKGKS